MPILAMFSAVPAVGASVLVAAISPSGARVEAVYMRPNAGPLPTNFKVVSRPASGAAQTIVGAAVASPTSSGARIDVKSPVERLEVYVDGSAGTTVDVHITSGLESEGS